MRCSGVFIVNFKHFTPCSSVSIANIEQVNVGLGVSELIASYSILRCCSSESSG